MKYDLDLRSPEYISSTRFLKRGAVKAAAVFGLLMLPLVLLFAFEQYAADLSGKNAALEAEVAVLTLRAEPLLSMADQTEHFRAGLDLSDRVTAPSKGWPSYLQAVRSAAPPDLVPEVILFTAGGNLEIRGGSKTMRGPAEYRDRIEALDFTGQTSLLSITKKDREAYSFIITALTGNPEGVEAGED